MHIKTIAAAAVITTALFAVSSGTASAENNNRHAQPAVTVAKGDTLAKIAAHYHTSYKRLFDANHSIKHPDRIYPGQVIRIPSSAEQLTARQTHAVRSARAAQKSAAQHTPKPNPVQRAVVSDATVWDRLARCESSGKWAINTGNGYYGGLQFTLASWRGVGGSGYPHQASREEQIMHAERLLARQGWNAWPACARKLGLR